MALVKHFINVCELSSQIKVTIWNRIGPTL